MADKRKNIKVPKPVFDELDEAREMTWPDQLLHWKRIAELKEDNE